MKQNIILFLCSALVCGTAGCNGIEEAQTENEKLVHSIIDVVGNGNTRATGVTSSEEDNIKNLQIFVFDEKGNKEYYVNAGSSSSGEVVTTEGKKTVTVIVNGPDLEDIGTRTALMSSTSLLSDNSLGSMVMTGETEATLQDGGRITIPVTRIISKVVIRKISSAFSSNANASKDFRIRSIYLINVAGDCNYSASARPTIWYNKLSEGRNDNACISFPLLSDPVNTSIAYRSSYNKEHSFFCYPNPSSAGSSDSSWSPRHTMLVVEALLGGEQTYYPIELPVIGRNKCIIIDELIITKRGSDYPYVTVSEGSCSVNITVEPWDVVLEYTESI